MKPSLLLISGWAVPAVAWKPVVRRLESTWDVQVIGADAVVGEWTPDQEPAVVVDQIRAHLPAARPCYLGGWSLGGMLALQAASALTDDISGVLLISATAYFCQDEAQPWGIPEATVRAMIRSLRSEPERTLERFYVSSAAPEEPDAEDMAEWVQYGLDHIDALHAGLQYLRHTDLRDRISCGGLPTVLIHGRDDAIIPYSASRALGVRLRPSRIDFASEAGHDLPLRRADMVVKGLHALLTMCE